VIKLLYVVLVASTIVVLGVAAVIYWRIRRHMKASARAVPRVAGEEETAERQSASERVHRR
jgi:hypothetical protein